MSKSKKIVLAGAALGALATCPILGGTSAFAQGTRPAGADDGAASGGIEEIIVTAQKRQDSINDVGMSITAVTGEALLQQGVTQPSDLAKVVPGFNFTQSSYGVPVYTLRGIGFYDTSLAGSPTVSVYVDEVPLPYSVMTSGAGLDVERVEVLKGPQGTLFGQNSTGGAINYIAAKPTRDFSMGADFTYARFNEINVGGFVSGPLSDTLSARVSVRYQHGDDWQKSYTRNDSIGGTDLLIGRLLLSWTPDDRLDVQLSASGWIDKSDTQAGQFIGIIGPTANVPAVVRNYPLSPRTARAADWDPMEDFSRDDRFYLLSARVGYDLGGGTSLTSLTAYQHLDRDSLSDADGTDVRNFHVLQQGYIRSFYQELRLDGEAGDGIRWLVGANYGKDRVHEELSPFTSPSFSTLPYSAARADGDTRVRTLAAFANLEWKITPTLTLQGGARYTDIDRDYAGCTFDTGAGDIAATFAAIASARRGETVVIPAGTCATLGPDFLPAMVVDSLNEDNLSWRAGVNWEPNGETLLYANVSRGYKGGAFPVSGSTFSSALDPAVQETVLAYEAGFKLGLMRRSVQLNGAVFYYDYSDKQIRGRISDPILGRLNKLINIPDSRIAGAELQATVAPVRGLLFNGGVTYIDSRIKGSFIASDALGTEKDLGGEPFPLTPKWQAQADAEYEFGVGGALNAFIGGHMSYQGATNSGLGELPILAIDDYTLFDARAGLRAEDGRWSVTAFVRNLTNKYYWNFASFASPNTAVRFTGRPRTFGLTLRFRN